MILVKTQKIEGNKEYTPQVLRVESPKKTGMTLSLSNVIAQGNWLWEILESAWLWEDTIHGSTAFGHLCLEELLSHVMSFQHMHRLSVNVF